MTWKHILISGLVELASLSRRANFATGRLSKCVLMNKGWKYSRKGKENHKLGACPEAAWALQTVFTVFTCVRRSLPEKNAYF